MKKIIPCLYLSNGNLVAGFEDRSILSDNTVDFVSDLTLKGADEIIIFDLSDEDAEHELNILKLREINKSIDIPTIAAGNIKRLEDVKKLIYAGSRAVSLNMAKASNVELIEEAGKRFGKDKIYVSVDSLYQLINNCEVIKQYTDGILLLSNEVHDDYSDFNIIPVLNENDVNGYENILKKDCVYGLSGDFVNNLNGKIMDFKHELLDKGYEVNIFKSSLNWDDFKLNSDGHLTVVVQDYKTDEVLMVAYMNREAFEKTVETGIMTYYSRSRNELWVKGLTSGHFQYVRSLIIDCDHDTLLAKVHQVGAACHTGNRSCFFEEILHTDYAETNPLKVFENVYNVILDRKVNPKEGSYTNYLFDKGIDKILKKVGEEATEIVIAAKNPDHEEVKYEIADFLYHVMVLMAECELDWDDITKELANR